MTSDLGMYLNDGYNCITVDDETSESIACSLLRALSLTSDQKYRMRFNARQTAEKHFDYRLYLDDFYKYIHK